MADRYWRRLLDGFAEGRGDFRYGLRGQDIGSGGDGGGGGGGACDGGAIAVWWRIWDG